MLWRTLGAAVPLLIQGTSASPVKDITRSSTEPEFPLRLCARIAWGNDQKGKGDCIWVKVKHILLSYFVQRSIFIDVWVYSTIHGADSWIKSELTKTHANIYGFQFINFLDSFIHHCCTLQETWPSLCQLGGEQTAEVKVNGRAVLWPKSAAGNPNPKPQS